MGDGLSDQEFWQEIVRRKEAATCSPADLVRRRCRDGIIVIKDGLACCFLPLKPEDKDDA